VYYVLQLLPSVPPEVGPVSAQSDTCFLVQNRSFLNIFTFHLKKTHQKNVKIFTIGACVCVFKKKFENFENSNFR
jgi:hypothetical protein